MFDSHVFCKCCSMFLFFRLWWPGRLYRSNVRPRGTIAAHLLLHESLYKKSWVLQVIHILLHQIVVQKYQHEKGCNVTLGLHSDIEQKICPI